MRCHLDNYWQKALIILASSHRRRIACMSVWEKLAAAIAETSMGATIMGAPFSDRAKHNTPADDALPFTMGMVTLGAKMAKADGVISQDEVHAFKKAFKVSDSEMKHVARVFNRAKQNAVGYEAYAAELVAVLKGDRKLLEYVLEGLFIIANADKEMHPQEEEYLRHVARLFGFADAEFALIKARHAVGAQLNPYDVLGVKPSVSNEGLETQYRRLIAESETGEFLERGMPKEFVRIATAKREAVKQAYEAIAKERKINIL
jgi:DnaJ like chaperone protein